MPDRRKQIQRLRTERIPENDDISAADAEQLLAFSDEMFLRSATYSDARHEKLLRHCVLIAEGPGGLADALDDREAAKRIVRWINQRYENEETNRDYRVAIRVFGRRVSDENGDDPPDSIDWIPSGTSKNYDPAPDPSAMLHWEDHVLPMIEATENKRDAAVIAVAFDAGARSGEFRALRVGDVTDHEHGLRITVDGKQGQRSITLIPSVPYLQEWLREHPARDDPDAPLWCQLSSADALSFRMYKKLLEQAAERAEVTRPVTLTNFRKSSASFLASRGMSQAHLEEHHGWTRGSDVAGRYIAVFADDSDRELARIHGLDISESEPDPIGPLTCPRCEKETPRSEEFCVWCNQALNQDAVQQLKTDERRVQQAVMGIAKDDPSLLDEVEERNRIIQVIQDNPELARQVQAFIDETAHD